VEAAAEIPEGKTGGRQTRNEGRKRAHKPVTSQQPARPASTKTVHHTSDTTSSTARAECAQCRNGGRRHEGRPPIGPRVASE
jgi:hypothetical protein